jgi:hypothetical protein
LGEKRAGLTAPVFYSYWKFITSICREVGLSKAYHQTETYQKAMRKRGVWVEPLFGEAKEFHRLRRFRLRGLHKVNIEGMVIAAGQNYLKFPLFDL